MAREGGVPLQGKTCRDLVKLAFSPEQIKAFTPMPQDFLKFWQKAVKEARQVPLEPENTP